MAYRFVAFRESLAADTTQYTYAYRSGKNRASGAGQPTGAKNASGSGLVPFG